MTHKATSPKGNETKPPAAPGRVPRKGADVEIDFNGATPDQWLVDGKPVREWRRETLYVYDAGQVVQAVVLITTDGERYPLWNPEDTP